MKSMSLVLLSSFCIPFAAKSQTADVHSGLRMSVDADDRNPALIIVVPDGAESVRSSKILFPEHVTVRAHGQSEQEHLYIFRAGSQGYSPNWKKTGNALEYARDFDQIHFVARATLNDDGIVFHYEFTNHSEVNYDMVTAITDPRFHAVFYDPRLQRTYVHHKDGFDLLASETPARLTIPLNDWFPARYLASYTAPVPKDRVQHRDDGITYYYKSRSVDVPMIATLSEDRTWVAASFARNSGNVWSNPELTCQHVDPEVPLPHNGHAAYEVKILIFNGSLEDALRKVLAQRNQLE
ncbi:MAG TPA: hypothetical protein VG498_16540 [Terriglobales bacterium]|nr:hypothetical protein [Terriglobales bacterium]